MKNTKVAITALMVIVACGCSSEPTLDEARDMQIAGRYKDSMEPLRQLIEQGGAEPEVFYLYGRALSTEGERDAALWPLRKAMEDEEWLAPAGMQLARNAFDTGNQETALITLDRVIEAQPDDVKALVLRSRSRIESRRNLELALADADRALEIDPDSNAARIARVLALLAQEMVEEAGIALEQMEDSAFEAGPDTAESARFCGARASFAKEKGDIEVAVERYAKCLNLFPGSQILVADAIKFYEARRDRARVIEVLQAALEDSPEIREFRVGLAMRLGAAGRNDEAAEVLREATDSANPVLAARAWMDLAGFLIDTEQYEEGLVAFEKVLEADPDPAPELLFRYADILLVAERFDEALALVEEMRVPAHQHLVRGRVHLEREEFGRALAEFSAGLETWPENPVARYYAALAAEGLGRFDRAVEEFRYSIRAGASQTDARLRLGKLHAAEGALNNAIVILRHNLTENQADADMAELELEILAASGSVSQIPQHLQLVINRPSIWQRAVRAIARGTNRRSGAKDAAQFIADTGADFTDPTLAPVLKDYALYLAEDQRFEEAEALARAGLDAHPDRAVFHSILGHVLLRQARAAAEAEAEGTGSADATSTSTARAEFDRALELDPDDPDGLIGAGLMARDAGEFEVALDHFLRADTHGDQSDPTSLRRAANLQIELGRPNEAEATLETILERDPYAGPAALKLVELRVNRGAERELRTQVLASLAMRFGGEGPAAIEVLKLRAAR